MGNPVADAAKKEKTPESANTSASHDYQVVLLIMGYLDDGVHRVSPFNPGVYLQPGVLAFVLDTRQYSLGVPFGLLLSPGNVLLAGSGPGRLPFQLGYVKG